MPVVTSAFDLLSIEGRVMSIFLFLYTIDFILADRKDSAIGNLRGIYEYAVS